MFVDLMVYDIQEKKDGVCSNDFENCLQDFLLEQYNVEDEDRSIGEVADIMMKVRRELIKAANETQSLWS